jgi:hypothetical protein
MLYSPKGDSERAGEPEGGTNTNCILEILLIPLNARFLTQLNRIPEGYREIISSKFYASPFPKIEIKKIKDLGFLTYSLRVHINVSPGWDPGGCTSGLFSPVGDKIHYVNFPVFIDLESYIVNPIPRLCENIAGISLSVLVHL